MCVCVCVCLGAEIEIVSRLVVQSDFSFLLLGAKNVWAV